MLPNEDVGGGEVSYCCFNLAPVDGVTASPYNSL